MMKPIVLLILGLSLPAAHGANKYDAKKSAKKAKVAVAAAPTGKRTIAQSPSKYECKINRHTSTGKVSEAKTIEGEAKFVGIEPHEEITMTNKDGKHTMVVNAFMESPANPYIIDSYTCDDYLNCSGDRKIYSPRGVRTKKFQVTPNGYSVHAILGTADVFQYRRNGDGYSFRAIQVMLNASKFYGVEVTCLAR